MGGYGSGRQRGGPTVESALTLDMPSMMRKRLVVPGMSKTGSLLWRNPYGSGERASMRYSVTFNDDEGELILVYRTRDSRTDESRIHDCRIRLVSTPQPFGGRRWWFVCPKIGKLVLKLHMPPDHLTFGSREAYKLSYATQRQSPRDRATGRAFRLRRRLGDTTGGVGDPVYKPKWMRHATFEREVERIWNADDACDEFLMATIGRLLGTKRRPAVG